MRTIKGECQLLRAYWTRRQPAEQRTSSQLLQQKPTRMAVTLVLWNTMRVTKIEQIHSKTVLAGRILKKRTFN